MGNNRQAIRAALATMLSGQTDADTRVFTNRSDKYWKTELPAINITTEQESAIPHALQGRRYNRTVILKIEIRLEDNVQVDDSLDEMLADIEAIVDSDPSFGGTVLNAIQTNSEISVEASGEKTIGVGILSFECKYIS